jgi:hypothetical protein
MGLDVWAYRGLKSVGPTTPEGENIEFYKNPDFPGRADDIDDSLAYEAEEVDSVYSAPYSAYGRWREQLARLSGWNTPEHVWNARPPAVGPFVELINFADDEGCFGPSVCAKLARDFAELQPKVDDVDDRVWVGFRANYARFRRAFEMAAQGGAVAFR